MEEKIRAERLKLAQSRKRFIITRGSLKQKLGHFLDCSPETLRFSYGEHGKPVLAEKYAANPIAFSVSHSGDRCLIALTKQQQIGIDLEKINHHTDYLAIAKRYFSITELVALNALPDTSRRRGFFAGWTRKEAFLKSIGAGLSFGLDSFEVSVDPDATSPFLHADKKYDQYLFDISVGKDYMATLSAPHQDTIMRCWES